MSLEASKAGDLAEMEIVGARLEDVLFPFQRSMLRHVSEYPNVTEFYGGTCHACVWAAVAVPPDVDPRKKYAVISGTWAFIGRDLEEFDEVWLVGQCACNAREQLPGFSDKIKAAKETVRIPSCPAWTHLLGKGMFRTSRPPEIPDVIRPEAAENLKGVIPGGE